MSFLLTVCILTSPLVSRSLATILSVKQHCSAFNVLRCVGCSRTHTFIHRCMGMFVNLKRRNLLEYKHILNIQMVFKLGGFRSLTFAIAVLLLSSLLLCSLLLVFSTERSCYSKPVYSIDLYDIFLILPSIADYENHFPLYIVQEEVCVKSQLLIHCVRMRISYYKLLEIIFFHDLPALIPKIELANYACLRTHSIKFILSILSIVSLLYLLPYSLLPFNSLFPFSFPH